RLLHQESGIWVDRTSSLDPIAQVVCATTSTLSPFVAASSPGAPPMPPVISSPVSGSLTSSIVPITGAGLPGATIMIYDAAIAIGSTTAGPTGTFGLTVNLALGPHTLTATQTAAGG